MRILFVGDVVGKSGRQAIQTYLPECVTKLKVDLCVVNGENAADQGFGITAGIYEELLASGADAVTLGTIPGIGRRPCNSSATALVSSGPSII